MECFKCEKERIERLLVWSPDHYLSPDFADYSILFMRMRGIVKLDSASGS